MGASLPGCDPCRTTASPRAADPGADPLLDPNRDTDTSISATDQPPPLAVSRRAHQETIQRVVAATIGIGAAPKANAKLLANTSTERRSKSIGVGFNPLLHSLMWGFHFIKDCKEEFAFGKILESSGSVSPTDASDPRKELFGSTQRFRSVLSASSPSRNISDQRRTRSSLPVLPILLTIPMTPKDSGMGVASSSSFSCSKNSAVVSNAVSFCDLSDIRYLQLQWILDFPDPMPEYPDQSDACWVFPERRPAKRLDQHRIL